MIIYPLPNNEKRKPSDLSPWQDGALKPSSNGLYLREFDDGKATFEMGSKVAIRVDDAVQIHMDSPDRNYATLCGLDGDDPDANQYPATVRPGDKINCPDCKAIWMQAKKYRSNEFE